MLIKLQINDKEKAGWACSAAQDQDFGLLQVLAAVSDGLRYDIAG
jgi:hypothetical protein